MNMSNLNELSDAELSAVFAVEVADWKKDNSAGFSEPLFIHKNGNEEFSNGLPKFATSMDAVLPYITKLGWAELLQWDMVNGKSVVPRWRVRVLVRGSYIEGTAPTLPRAACIALILAERAEKEAAK